MGKATERLFLELMRFQVPELVDMDMPVEGAFHNLMLVSIRKRYPGHARKAMMSLWGAGLVSLEKAILVFDEDVDVHDPALVTRTLLDRLDVARDMLVVDQLPTDTLDHAAPAPDLGSHVGLDATTPLPGEPPRRAPPATAPMPDEAQLRAAAPDIVATRQPHPRLLLASIRKNRAGQARETMLALWNAGLPPGVVLVVYDGDVDLAHPSLAVFYATANLDPARDIVVDGERLGIDATIKMPQENAREWPPLIRMDEATRALVTKKWHEYGIG